MRTAFAVLAVLTTAVPAGVFFAVAVSVLPALFALPAGQYVVLHRLLGRGYHPVMPIITNTATVADLALLGLGPHRAWWLAAALAMVGVQAVSHLANVPINRTLRGLDPAAIAPDWRDPRPAWRRWHALRTGFAFASLALVTTAVLPH